MKKKRMKTQKSYVKRIAQINEISHKSEKYWITKLGTNLREIFRELQQKGNRERLNIVGMIFA